MHAVCISLINFTKKKEKRKDKMQKYGSFFFFVELELRMELERDEEGVLCDCLKQQTQRWIFSAVMVSYGHWISIRLFHSSSIIVLTEKHAHRQLHTERTCLITSCGRNVFFFPSCFKIFYWNAQTSINQWEKIQALERSSSLTCMLIIHGLDRPFHHGAFK